jgi:hypothetical protein
VGVTTTAHTTCNCGEGRVPISYVHQVSRLLPLAFGGEESSWGMRREQREIDIESKGRLELRGNSDVQRAPEAASIAMQRAS